MDLFKVINTGIKHSGVFDRDAKQRLDKLTAQQRYEVAATEAARAQWIAALTTDETRAWLSISEQDRAVLTGLIAILTMAAMAKIHDDGHSDSVEVRVIRGAISAATQCADAADCVITAEYAQAFSSAAARAKEIFTACTVKAVFHAAQQLHNFVNAPQVH